MYLSPQNFEITKVGIAGRYGLHIYDFRKGDWYDHLSEYGYASRLKKRM
jgi:hypothetical protein